MKARASPTALAILALGIVQARALSLRSSKAEIFLGAVRPGGVLALSRSEGGALATENTGGESVSLRALAQSPPLERLRDGFEPLPDLRWVRLSQTSHALDPGQRSETEIVVTVPKDRRWEGGQYQFDCLLQGRGSTGSAATLRTAVLLAVGDGDPPELPPEPEGSGLIVSPGQARVEGVSLGRRVAARSERFQALKLANAGQRERLVRLSPVRIWDRSVRLEEGWTPAPNPRWLKVGPALRVPPGGVARAGLELEIPAQARYRGRRWAFVVAVDAEGGETGRTGRSWWVLYVRTADEEERR